MAQAEVEVHLDLQWVLFPFFGHIEPNHTPAYPQRGQSAVAYNWRGGKIAINRHDRRSPAVSLQFH